MASKAHDVSVISRVHYEESDSLTRHLRRAGFNAERFLENLINVSPEVVRQIIVHLSSITEQVIAALTAYVIIWAAKRRRLLKERNVEDKVRVCMSDSPGITVLVSKDDVRISGHLPDLLPKRVRRKRKPPKGKKKIRPDKRRLAPVIY
jgi:hypothetical protein